VVATGNPLSVQWAKGPNDIQGAIQSSLPFNNAQLGDSGTYTVRAFNNSGSLSATSSVTVIRFPPIPLPGAIIRNDGVVEVGVGFDEPVNSNDLVAANFSIPADPNATFRLAQNSYNTYQGVILDSTVLTPGNTYSVLVKNVTDLNGNALPASGTNVSFTVGNVKWAESGTPIAPGQVVPFGNNGFDVLNGGRQEWDVYDEVTFAYVMKTNDFDVKVQVISVEPASKWTRAGLQARNVLNVGEPSTDHTNPPTLASAYAQTHVNNNLDLADTGLWPAADPIQPQNSGSNNSHEQNTRLAAGSTSSGWLTDVNPGAPSFPDVWLRIKRVGSLISGYGSTDGVNWLHEGDVTLVDQTNIMHVGVSLSAETGNIWNAADFDVWNAPYNPTYDRLFLTQFRNFGDVASAAPSISIGLAGGSASITFTGTLQSSTTVNGTYTDVPGSPPSPYPVPPGAGPHTFYRSRQ
jgi:hypothetical protein